MRASSLTAAGGGSAPLEPEAAARPTPASMSPLLLASVCSGSWRALGFLINTKDVPGLQSDAALIQAFLDLLDGDAVGSGTESSLATQQAFHSEGGSDEVPWPAAAPLLEGTTTGGDTALHVLATYGEGGNFLKSADIVYRNAKHLLFKQNKKGDTPLHCAARAGRSEMVSHLIALASGEASSAERLKEVVRIQNEHNETALHEAVRLGSKHVAELLMMVDSELASFPKEGTSPLYLAILLERIDIAESLYLKSGGNLSYSGPNGQNALHAAVLRGQEMTRMLLAWNIGLANQGDQNGSTPLHFATSVLCPKGVHFWVFRPWFPWNHRACHSSMPFKQVLQANLAPIYQPDNKGLFPVHIAANIGANEAVVKFLEKCPNVAGLRDSKGRTFLHVAVEKKQPSIVAHACQTPSLSRIWNLQDSDGNTALHLAVKLGEQNIFSLLLENRDVRINLTNNNGQTPLDLSESMIRAGSIAAWNPRFLIDVALKYCQAKHGNHRLDHFEEQYIQPVDEEKQSEYLSTSTQTLIIGSVLMATAAFTASFTLPGGYKDDGTPALAGRYVFDAFIAANSLAFGSAGLATMNLMYSGTAFLDMPLRRKHLQLALYITFSSATSLATAFVLGMYLMLASVASLTATVMCVVASVLSLLAYMDTLRGRAVAKALYARMGNRSLVIFAQILVIRTSTIFWPMIASFIWAEISTKHRHK
uniref:PGG domain-containing protein n=1 Tax=Arundo donax TaxID=35708 RepID=A0A0A9FU91_ARUDO